MTQETLQEAVARAIAEIEGFDPAMDCIEGWYETADAAIATMFERLRTDLDMAVDLIQEAKGYEGPSGGPVTDHLDAAETHIDRVLTAFQQENSDGR